MPQFLSYPSNRQSFPNLDYTVPFGNGIAPPEPEPQLLRTGFSESPPEFSVSVTPVEQDYSRFDELMPVADNWDQATYDQFLGMGGDTHLSNAFDMTNILDFMNPQQASQVPHECTGTAPKPLPFSYGSIEQPRAPLRHQDSSLSSQSTMDVDSSAHSAESDGSRGLLASQESWPFFSCNRVPKSGCFPPTTAAMYVEGLTRVLTTHPWQLARTTQHEDAQTTVAERLQDSKINNSIIGHSTETLDAAAQAILQKACTTHDSGPILINGKENQCTISLPPREAILRFIESYLNHHEHYYFACAADLRQADSPVLQSSVRASSLLMLLMVAQGAAFISIPAARYLASGLIEACRLFLFESIERDILLSREPTVLHSALLFTTAAAWSGDNWHMDIAMGQRGMYIAVSVYRLHSTQS